MNKFDILVITRHRRYRIMIKFYQYPNCTTCKKTKFLKDYGVSFEPIDIVQHTPTKSEFKEILVEQILKLINFSIRMAQNTES